MKRFLTYTWPIFVYVILSIASVFVDILFDPIIAFKINYYTPSPGHLMISLGGIYYLVKSPFGKTQIRGLSILLLCRLLFHTLSLGNSYLASLIHISVDLFIFIFYLLRSAQKEKIGFGDYAKTAIFLLIVLGWVLFQSSMEGFAELWLQDFDRSEIGTFQYYLIIGVEILLAVFIFIHIIMLYRTKEGTLNPFEEKLIEDLGKDEDYPSPSS